ncbi:hypothetical protein OYC64_001617 [Pagothenia borchgrevinki]|uniref:Uncharacterized protein n=1 Tax=Pagothenia borchgrevinki TaxID=8213 RepID=A0ABD2GCK3_PAGBO
MKIAQTPSLRSRRRRVTLPNKMRHNRNLNGCHQDIRDSETH